MPEGIADPTIAHQVELIIRRFASLSTLPCVAAQFLPQLLQAQPSTLAEVIESDPALAAKILSIMHKHRLNYSDDSISIHHRIDRLPAHIVCQALLSVKIYPAFGQDINRIVFRKQLMMHSLAVACCAENIAEIVLPPEDSKLAYFAGLLHDIGKFALDEAMPRSFAGIVGQAKLEQACSQTLEQRHLCIDHTTVGKRLAVKWHLPERISLAIWLHHSDVNLITQSMPEAKVAQVVQLADLIARQCGIGQSGSFDIPDSGNKTAQALAITPGQLEKIRQRLPEKTAQKSEVLGLDSPITANDYCNAIHTTAAQLARRNAELSLETRRLQTDLSHFDFAKEFLLSINPNDELIDITENFAIRWQKFYQTDLVCLYLAAPADSQFLKAVVVENPSQAKAIILNAPAGTAAIPKAIINNFAILNAEGHADWLFEQLDVQFDLSCTKLVPLLSGGRAIGAIIFELHYPAETRRFEEMFGASACIAGAVLGLAFAFANQQRFAEQFSQMLSEPAERQPQAAESQAAADALNALAEMAAGAAHELNNPLAVISGRAQTLAGSETDAEKKQILKQIQQNADEISAIIDDLFAFASPPKPQQSWTDYRKLLDEAIQLASQKTGVEHIDARIEVAGDIKKVFVDSAQIVSAIANVISNSLQSYPDKAGPVKIITSAEKSGAFVKLTISDHGCGMDTETVRKATQPFFSNQPAGRKRGMGLAHAARLIRLNGGELSITSQPDSGTIIAILLPCE